MLGFLARRVALGLGVMLALSVIAFGMVRLIPGDPVSSRLGLTTDPDVARQVRADLGLDAPWPGQYLEWMGGVVTGDLGTSLTDGRSISADLGDRLPVSLQLAGMATVVALLTGVPVGVFAGSRAGRWPDVLARMGGFVTQSIPPFVAGTVLILVISKNRIDWPTLGYVPFREHPWGNIRSLLLPSLVLGLPIGAVLARYVRSSIIDVLGQNFIRTARAKGAGTTRLLLVHGLRNVLVPLVTVASVQFAALVGGTVVIEQVFSIPGVGALLVQSVTANDYPAIQGCILAIGLAFVITNLVVDLLYPLIDPRIRRG